MGSIIRFSIRHPGVIIGLAFIIIAYGIHQIKQSPLNVFPEFSPTQVIIILQHLKEYDLKSKGVNNNSTNQTELLKELTYKILHS